MPTLRLFLSVVYKKAHAFTLMEILISIGILAFLSAAAVIVINPAERLKEARDSQRIQELSSLEQTIQLLETQIPNLAMGTSTYVYVSIPDNSATCANLGLPSLPGGYTYACTTASNYRKTDGSGWIPINFQISGLGNIPNLPIDPVNSTSSGFYYTYTSGGSFELNSLLESKKHRPSYTSDGGDALALFEKGSNKALYPLNDSGLVGYWNFDEETGIVAKDSSTYGNNGTLTNFNFSENSNWKSDTDCKVGGCIRLDGSNDYVEIGNPSSLAITGPLTLAAWARLVQTSGDYQMIASRGRWSDGGYVLTWHSGNGTPYIFLRKTDNTNYFYANGTTPHTPLSLNSWYFLVGTYDGSQVKFYVNDGTGTIQTNTGILENGLNFNIGRRSGVGGQHFNGYIDEVRVYNRALTPLEIKTIYNATK